jgi:hypothetical protein
MNDAMIDSEASPLAAVATKTDQDLRPHGTHGLYGFRFFLSHPFDDSLSLPYTHKPTGVPS